MLLAAAAQPSATQIWIPAILSTIATVIGGWLVYRTSRKANATTETATLSASQLAWTQQAMNEATAAKVEARAATAAAGEAERSAKMAQDTADEASRRATVAEGRLAEVTTMADRLIDWINRVVRKAHADGIGDDASPAVTELLRVINGGPPEISSSRLRRRQQGGQQ